MLSRADIYQSHGELVIESDLPGVAEEDIEILASRDRVRIKFRRKAAHGSREVEYFKQERVPGEFSRDLKLPRCIDPSSLWAHLDHGTLKIRMHFEGEALGEQSFRLSDVDDSTTPGVLQ